jgi:acyl-CoA thioester hydrolase
MSEYSTTIALRFGDFDLYGHVNSVTYFSYLETARVKIFYRLFEELTRKGILLLVRKAECDYLLPILPVLEEIIVTMEIARIGTTSFTLAYRLHDQEGTTYATGQTLMVAFDSRSGQTMAVPDEIRAMA